MKTITSTDGCFDALNKQGNALKAANTSILTATGDGVLFDASLTSSIFVNGGSVRPKSLSVLALLKL